MVTLKHKKQTLHQYKIPIAMKNLVINKIVVSNKVSLGKKSIKYFIGYKDAKRLEIYPRLSSEMSAYRRDFNDTKNIYIFDQR